MGGRAGNGPGKWSAGPAAEAVARRAPGPARGTRPHAAGAGPMTGPAGRAGRATAAPAGAVLHGPWTPFRMVAAVTVTVFGPEPPGPGQCRARAAPQLSLQLELKTLATEKPSRPQCEASEALLPGRAFVTGTSAHRLRLGLARRPGAASAGSAGLAAAEAARRPGDSDLTSG